MSADRQALRDAVWALPVFDTHTHLVGGTLAARTFWDVGHYFWFLRELRAAGYPLDAEQLPEDQRIEAFVAAFAATRNTAMNWVVRRLLGDLHGVTITDAASVRAADAAIRATADQPNWPAQVCERGGVAGLVVNVPRDIPFPELPAAGRCLPRLEGALGKLLEQVAGSPDQGLAADEAQGVLGDLLGGYKAAGCRGVMTSEAPFGRLEEPCLAEPPALAAAGNPRDALSRWLLHALCQAAEEHDLLVQLFLGVEGWWPGGAAPANAPDRILHRHGLFQRYRGVRFDLVLGANLANLDAVQAARMFPNVSVGGLWWYNFRPSTYRESMQHRLEGLPPAKCSLVASDARCIEWCYGKIALVKTLLADFLAAQLDAGWLTWDDALWVAREWLHDAPARFLG